MMYSPSAVHLLHLLGIPLEWVKARHLQEHAEAIHLETAERGADGQASSQYTFRTPALSDGVCVFLNRRLISGRPVSPPESAVTLLTG